MVRPLLLGRRGFRPAARFRADRRPSRKRFSSPAGGTSPRTEEQIMADPRFFQRHGPFSLRALAASIGADIAAADAGDIEIVDIAALHAAVPGDIALFDDPRCADAFRATHASAVITTRALADGAPAGAALLFAKAARLAFAGAAACFYPPQSVEPGIDPAARVHVSARLGTGCQIDAGSNVG